jgi:hypothetical protein
LKCQDAKAQCSDYAQGPCKRCKTKKIGCSLMPRNDQTRKTDRHRMTDAYLKQWRQDNLVHEKVDRKGKGKQPERARSRKTQLGEEQEEAAGSASSPSTSLPHLEDLTLESVPSPTDAPSGSRSSSRPHRHVHTPSGSRSSSRPHRHVHTPSGSRSSSRPHLHVRTSVPEPAAASAAAAATTSAAATFAAATSAAAVTSTSTAQISESAAAAATSATPAAAADDEAHLAMLDVIEHHIGDVEEWAADAGPQLEDDANPFPHFVEPPQLNIQQTGDGVPIVQRISLLERRVESLNVWRADADFWLEDRDVDFGDE